MSAEFVVWIVLVAHNGKRKGFVKDLSDTQPVLTPDLPAALRYNWLAARNVKKQLGTSARVTILRVEGGI